MRGREFPSSLSDTEIHLVRRGTLGNPFFLFPVALVEGLKSTLFPYLIFPFLIP